LDFCAWSFWPHFSAAPKTSSVRATETRAFCYEEDPFRGVLKTRRCVVPVSGFYEWRTEGKKKFPFHITLKSGYPIAFAAFTSAEGEVCTVTTAPNAEMATVHDRMPVILPRDVWDVYLDAELTDPDAIAPMRFGFVAKAGLPRFRT
jgi:putative SOS response-associated peptidase YedK